MKQVLKAGDGYVNISSPINAFLLRLCLIPLVEVPIKIFSSFQFRVAVKTPLPSTFLGLAYAVSVFH